MKLVLVLISLFMSSLVIASELSYGLDNYQHPEDRLLDAIQDIQSADFNKAEEKLQGLIAEMPDFKLAQLVYADVLKSRVDGVALPAMGLQESEEKALLLKEIRNRYRADNDDSIRNRVPSVLARLDDHYRHAIVVDLNKSRLYLFENSLTQPVLIDDFFISMGRGGPGKVNEGDLKTPLGVYFVQSYISPMQLADKYGAGAYPINYPNAWDRLNGRTGHGIWLHGTRSGTYNRPPLASEGCVVLPNADLLNVGTYIDLKSTPVLIGEQIEWLDETAWQKKRNYINSVHTQWKQDWESLNVESYLSHYSSRFTSGKADLPRWSEHKRRIAKHKTFVKVELSNVSLLLHPDEEVMVATFLQSYASDNFSSQSWKRQYWNREEDGQWRIVFEDEISPPVATQLARNAL